MASGTASAAAGMSGGSRVGGVGGNIPEIGGMLGNTLERLRQQQMDKTATASATARAGARGLGGGMGKRMGSIESRLDALEGGSKGGNSVQSVQPIQEFVQGGSFGGATSTPPAPIATGSLNASASPGSLQEAMPSPGDPAADMFGTEFMRNASVGAAKMRMNKKI